MTYGIWGRPKEKEARAFHEKFFRRASLPPWDARWHALSVPARSAFLYVVKGPGKSQAQYGSASAPSVSVEKFLPRVLKELTEAGFVKVRPGTGKSSAERVFAVEDLSDFAGRVRAMGRYHLLNPDLPSQFSTYLNACFSTNELISWIHQLLHRFNLGDYLRLDDALEHYVLSHRWPEWVSQTLKDPLADRILSVVRQADRPLALAELPGRIAGEPPERVRTSLDKLIAHLVLFEDLDPDSFDLRVGLLPRVRDALDRASQPRQRPPLVICESPKELGPDESVLISDLRAFLLEVASEPPRLRQDKALFQKEVERFQDILDPLAPWMADVLKLTPEKRLDQALVWARHLKMVKETVAGKATHLQLLPKGQKWLGGSLVDQHIEFLAVFRAATTEYDTYSMNRSLFTSNLDSYGYSSYSDLRFLGVNVLTLKVTKGKKPPLIYEAKTKDFEALRTALDGVFSALPLGTFHRVDSVVDHFTFGEHNPLFLGSGKEMDQVVVYADGRQLPPLEERFEETGRHLIDGFVRRRLIPLGCVRTAIDDQGRLLIAREPLLDAYFGRKIALDPRAPGSRTAASEATRVVVQPDFSIVIIGPTPAPAAELIPFCERTTRGSGRGAIVLKITREAVVKAVAGGLKPAEIVARLKRHSSHEIPANVLREVQGWAEWVRTVTPETLTVIRCPDRETADRVMAALRKNAQRLQDTLVAITPALLTTIERNKLRDQGIILGSLASANTPKPKAKKKKRRRYYDDDYDDYDD